mgnify:FL=1
MTSAYFEIRKTYDYEDSKQIVNSGCESGVCFKHIYYADTIEFFNKYPDEITQYIIDNLGIEVITESFTRNNGEWDCHFNDLTWMFIESVAAEIVDEYESTTCEEMDDVIDYGEGRLTSATSQQASWYNPSRSMNDSRYSQV